MLHGKCFPGLSDLLVFHVLVYKSQISLWNVPYPMTGILNHSFQSEGDFPATVE